MTLDDDIDFSDDEEPEDDDIALDLDEDFSDGDELDDDELDDDDIVEDDIVEDDIVEDDIEVESEDDDEEDDGDVERDDDALDELEAEELEMLTEDEASEVIAIDEAAELRSLRREALALERDAEGAGSDEFVCQSCFLVKRTSQLANRRKKICRDCA